MKNENVAFRISRFYSRRRESPNLPRALDQTSRAYRYQWTDAVERSSAGRDGSSNRALSHSVESVEEKTLKGRTFGSPGFAGLRRLDRMNSQFHRDVTQLLNSLRFGLVVVRHFSSACARNSYGGMHGSARLLDHLKKCGGRSCNK